MKITLNLTKDELRALLVLIDENPCLSGCIWEECDIAASRIKDEKRQEDYCWTGCKFHKAQQSLSEKIDACIQKGGNK